MSKYQFKGSIDELKSIVENSGYSGKWTINKGNQNIHIFKSNNDEIINWWEESKALSFQGKSRENFIKKIMNAISKNSNKKLNNNKKIFIVHGHDDTTLEQLELILTKSGLEPFILKNNDNKSNTLIETLEENCENSSFRIVLLTPDDYGYSKDENEENRKPRARQNAILEMGMLMASLGRKRTIILQKGTLERPSDIEGIIRLDFNNHVKDIAKNLLSPLQKADSEINHEDILKAIQ